MKLIRDKFLILSIALFFSLAVMTACTSTKNGNDTKPDSTGTAQHSENSANKPEAIKETPRETPKETPAKPVESDVSGKYECCEIGVAGEHNLELKAGNTAIYKEKQEDSDSNGNGSWSWDKNKEFINVNLKVETESYGGENPEKSEITTKKVTFKLKKDGKNLRIVEETLSGISSDGYYIGKTFKKL